MYLVNFLQLEYEKYWGHQHFLSFPIPHQQINAQKYLVLVLEHKLNTTQDSPLLLISHWNSLNLKNIHLTILKLLYFKIKYISLSHLLGFNKYWTLQIFLPIISLGTLFNGTSTIPRKSSLVRRFSSNTCSTNLCSWGRT